MDVGEGDDDVFEENDNVMESPDEHKDEDEDVASAEISKIMNRNNYCSLTGSESFPNMDIAVLFNHPPTDTTPKVPPTKTPSTPNHANQECLGAKGKPVQSKLREERGSTKAKYKLNTMPKSEAVELSFVIDSFKSDNKAKTALRQRKTLDLMEESAVRRYTRYEISD